MPQVSVLLLKCSINTVRVNQQEDVINQRHTEVAPALPELILWLGACQKRQEKVEEQPPPLQEKSAFHPENSK